MPAVVNARVEGGDNGLLVEAQAKRAITTFFSIGIKKIQNQLNREAQQVANKWKTEPQTERMTNEGLPDLTYEAGLRELSVPFELFEPAKIVLDIVDSSHPRNSDVPAAQRFIDAVNTKYSESWIQVYLRAFNFEGKNIMLRFNPTIPFRCVIYHELIHACGDTPDLRGIVDGVIRHTTVGCMAILSLE
jgi:hypothetical protein